MQIIRGQRLKLSDVLGNQLTFNLVNRPGIVGDLKL